MNYDDALFFFKKWIKKLKNTNDVDEGKGWVGQTWEMANGYTGIENFEIWNPQSFAN